MLGFYRYLLFMSLFLGPGNGESNDGVSKLFGSIGEEFDPTGPLPDFSRSGLNRGYSIPEVTRETVSVADYGTVGDGETDDSAALKKAVEENPGAVIKIPKGRFVLRDILRIAGPNTALIGAGSEESVLVCDKPLELIESWPLDHPKAKTNYSFRGGFVWIQGASFQGESLTGVSAAKRGSLEIEVSNPDSLQVGLDVILQIDDDDSNGLIKYAYGSDTGDISTFGDKFYLRQMVRIRKIEGNLATLDVPIRFDLDPKFNARLIPYDTPRMHSVEIRGLGFEFPALPYLGHFTEMGFNGIYIQQAVNIRIHDVAMANCDNGINMSAGHHCEVSNVRFTSQRKPGPQNCTGHHAVSLTGQGNVLDGFEIDQRFIHDLTVERSSGNVFKNGKAMDLSIDHHRRAPYENLYSNIDAGLGERLFWSGGALGRGNHAGRRAVFWNIRSQTKQTWPEQLGQKQLLLIGLDMDAEDIHSTDGKWIESNGGVNPEELHAAQVLLAKGFDDHLFKWIDTKGRSMMAKFDDVRKGKVVAVSPEGKRIELPFNTLSVRSQKLARFLYKLGSE